MTNLAKSVEDTLLAKIFAAHKQLIAGLFFYFVVLLVVLYAWQGHGTPTRGFVWTLGLVEAGICAAVAAVALIWPHLVGTATTWGYATGFVYLVVCIGAVIFAPGPLDQHTLCVLALFVPLLYMAASLSTYKPMIRISWYGSIGIMALCLVPLIRGKVIDDQWVILAVIVAAQPSHFALQVGIKTLDRLIAQTANEMATGKSVMLGMLSHELRTPLQTIRATADLLKLRSIEAKQDTQHLDRILLASRQLEAHLKDLVEFSKLESGLAEIEWVKFDLAALVMGVADAYADVAALRKNTIELHLWQDKDLVIGDPNRVQQIVNNIVSNAVKYTEAGVIEIHTGRRTGKRDEVVISVRDTGVGIDPGKIESIWKPYLRLKNEKRSEGYGLGLAIVRMLVNMLGGSISVTSEVGKGSTFAVVLPMKSA